MIIWNIDFTCFRIFTEIEILPQTNIRVVFYNYCSLFYQTVKMILWSIRTLWYKGSAENKDKRQGRKQIIPLKNTSPDSKADFWEKQY